MAKYAEHLCTGNICQCMGHDVKVKSAVSELNYKGLVKEGLLQLHVYATACCKGVAC